MNDPIPLAQPGLNEDEIAAAVRVLRSGHLVQGPEVASFEQEFATLVDGRDCVAVNSGTSALWLSLLALGIGPGVRCKLLRHQELARDRRRSPDRDDDHSTFWLTAPRSGAWASLRHP